MNTPFITGKKAQDKKSAAKKSKRPKPEGRLDPALLTLVRLRVAQIYQSQVGAETHRRVLISRGESNKRLNQLAAWHESVLFSEQERTALAWGEAICLTPTMTNLKRLLEVARRHFNREQILSLTVAIMSITDWNCR
jgi:alkylhydroperoxidase family enzyme